MRETEKESAGFINKRTVLFHRNWIEEIYGMPTTDDRNLALKTIMQYGFTGRYERVENPVVHDFILRCMPQLEKDFAYYISYTQRNGYKP